jgi:hypothetical protein
MLTYAERVSVKYCASVQLCYILMDPEIDTVAAKSSSRLDVFLPKHRLIDCIRQLDI